MINLPKEWPLEEYKDCKTQNVVRKVRERGVDVEEMTKRVYHKARDNGRSPVQWDSSIHAGFSTTQPWMRIPDDYLICNAADQVRQPDSTFAFWRDMFALRKERDDLVYGSFEHLDAENERIFAYVRAGTFLVVLNFSSDIVDYTPPFDIAGARILRATGKVHISQSISLPPYTGALLEL